MSESPEFTRRRWPPFLQSRPSYKNGVQRMTEEAERLKSDFKHTASAHARAEGREDEIRSNLSAVEGELREARSVLRVA